MQMLWANAEVCAQIQTSGVFNFCTDRACLSSRSLKWLNKFSARLSVQEEGRVVTHSKQVINFPLWNLEVHFIILLPMFCGAALIFIQNIVLVFSANWFSHRRCPSSHNCFSFFICFWNVSISSADDWKFIYTMLFFLLFHTFQDLTAI